MGKAKSFKIMRRMLSGAYIQREAVVWVAGKDIISQQGFVKDSSGNTINPDKTYATKELVPVSVYRQHKKLYNKLGHDKYWENEQKNTADL
jgi:hypothetical protein